MASDGNQPGGVDELLPPAKLATLGLQHVLVMYAGAIAVPLIIAGALGLPAEQRAVLISADILACGLASLVQSLGLPKIGIRMPVPSACARVGSRYDLPKRRSDLDGWNRWTLGGMNNGKGSLRTLPRSYRRLSEDVSA